MLNVSRPLQKEQVMRLRLRCPDGKSHTVTTADGDIVAGLLEQAATLSGAAAAGLELFLGYPPKKCRCQPLSWTDITNPMLVVGPTRARR